MHGMYHSDDIASLANTLHGCLVWGDESISRYEACLKNEISHVCLGEGSKKQFENIVQLVVSPVWGCCGFMKAQNKLPSGYYIYIPPTANAFCKECVFSLSTEAKHLLVTAALKGGRWAKVVVTIKFWLNQDTHMTSTLLPVILWTLFPVVILVVFLWFVMLPALVAFSPFVIVCLDLISLTCLSLFSPR